MLALYAATGAAFAQGALLERVVDVDIRAQPLPAALIEFSREAGVQVVAPAATVGDLTTQGVHGHQSVAAALKALLEGTHLRFRQAGINTIGIEAEAQEPPAAQAGDAGGDVGKVFDPVVVVATAEGLSAMRTATPLREIPQTVSVISRDTLDQQNATDLTGALEQATGITLLQVNSQQNYFYSRGYRIDTIHIDGGAPLSLTNGFTDASAMDMAEFDHVEVLRGADALFGGNGNPGATVSEQRKRPTAKPEAGVELSAGSWNQYRGSVDLSGPLAGDGALRGRVVAAASRQDFFYHPADSRKKLLYGILEYDLTPATLLTVGGSYNGLHGVINGVGLPRYDTGADAHLPRSLSLTTPWSRAATTQQEIFAKLEHSFNEDWNLKVNLTRLRSSSSERMFEPVGPISSETRLMDSAYPERFAYTFDQPTFDATLTGAFDWSGRRQEVMAGIDYQHNSGPTRAYGYMPYATQVDPWNFDPAAFPAPTDDPYMRQVSQSVQTQYGAYAALRLRPLDGLSVIGGVRDSYYHETGTVDVSVFGNPIPASTNRYTDAGKLTPYAGVTYDLTRQYSVYLSYADIFHTNGGVVDRDYRLLPPADGANLEAGLKAAWYGGKLNATFALFRSNQTGMAVLDTSAPESGYSATCCYLGATNKSKGIDAEVSGEIRPGWQLTAGYTLDINRTDAGAALSSQTPRHLFKVWTNYRLPGAWQDWSVGGGVRAQTSNYYAACQLYVGGECSGLSRSEQGAYAVADLRVAYRIDPHWQAALSVDNLFDRVYYRTISSYSFGNWYGEPRSVLFKLEGRF